MATAGKYLEKREISFVTLKPQYIARDEADASPREVDNERPTKKQRVGDDGRGRHIAGLRSELCATLADVPVNALMPVCSGGVCRSIHDVNKYLETKPADIGPTCYVYKTRGHCPNGVTCRFGAGHITETGRNMVNPDQRRKYELHGEQINNFWTTELETQLRSRTYNFAPAEQLLKSVPPNPSLHSEIDFTQDVDFDEPLLPVPTIAPDDRLGPCMTSPEFRNHVTCKKWLPWKDKLIMPGIAHVTNMPFRRIVREFGADVTMAEPLVAVNLLEGSKLDWFLSQRHDTEKVFGVQVFGNNLFSLTRAAQIINDKINSDFIELRFGNHLNDSEKFHIATPAAIVKCLAMITKVPLTAFMHVNDVEHLAPTLQACNLSLLQLDGRSSPNTIEWDKIAKAAKLLPQIPTFATSDVFSYEEYRTIRERCPELAGLCISRGAMVKPWLFTEIKEQRVYDISSSERFEILKKFVNYGLEFWGSNNKGVELTRRFLLDWLSLLCKYIPVGLLEGAPQRLGDRSAKFVGRNDLETLMGSHEVKDWIKITEMLLGPVSDSYTYYPRFGRVHWPSKS